MSISKKGDSIWIVIIGVIFITIISLILLVPKSYFNMEKYIDMPIGGTSMNANLTTGVDVDTFERSFKNAFINPDTIGFTFSDGSNLLIARRCYQFTDFGCKYETDTVKRNRCEEYRKNWLNNADVKKYGLDKIDYSISSVMNYFDGIAAGQGPFNLLCRTYRLYSGNPGEITSVVMADVKNQKATLQKSIEGGVHVFIVQAPYHRNYSGEFLSVNYTSTTTQAVFDNYDDKTGTRRSAPSIEGKVVTYVVIIYGKYQRDGNSLNSYDLFDGTGAPSPSDDYLVKYIDKYYRSQEDNCKIKCAGSSDTYCGCGSTPVIPGFVANTAQGDKPSTSMKLELLADQRLPNPQDASIYYTNYNTLYKPSTSSQIINNLPDLNTPQQSIYPYQSKCVGPNYPLALQNDNNKNDLNATTLATFAVLYRVNPKSGFDKDVFKVMDEKYVKLS